MKVLIIGSGGREHAMAWKVSQSPLLDRLVIAPGNPGTATLGENIPIPAEGTENHARLAAFALEHQIDLVMIGPEAPLAQGLADRLRSCGIAVFGPSQAAAQIESSKAFAKDFMLRHEIPTARYAAFTQFEPALEYLRASSQMYSSARMYSSSFPLVIKASGLAAGKGVVIPENLAQAEKALRSMLVSGDLGSAGEEVILEERLEGPEVSILAFTDGKTVRVMPPAQDHKRLLDGNNGPNTGGMGAFAPAAICSPELLQEITQNVLQRAVDGLREEEKPFIGVLFAGMILTRDGPKTLEFNCRFGDPETQALLPLLDSDLLEIALACAEERLDACKITWKPGAAACVVAASEGYPDKPITGRPIRGLRMSTSGGKSLENTITFHAGTKLAEREIITAGGRVLGVTAWEESLEKALHKAYEAIKTVAFEGMIYRKDIGSSNPLTSSRASIGSDVLIGKLPSSYTDTAYASAGVSIDSGNRTVELIRTAVQSTYGSEVLAGIGAFGGLFDARALQRMQAPVLVASTDGVGTKVRLAAQAGSFSSVGIDLVNHCVNDILVQGARPLFFLDYIASSKLNPEAIAQAVTGIAVACKEAQCALLGGETAEMPGVYAPEAFDLAGTIVGIVEHESILPRRDLQPGDLLIGLHSSGPHTNGYSLIRKVFEGVPLETVFPEIGYPLGEALLAPHRSYLPLLWPILSRSSHPIKALAHLTGGGFIENIPRVLPEGLGAIIQDGSWKIPPIFQLIRKRGGIAKAEMYHVFNLGIGMVIVIAAKDLPVLQQAIPEEIFIIGKLISGERKVSLQ